MGTIERLLSLQNEKYASSLKTCPICGKAPILQSNKYDPWGDGGGTITDYWYECNGCGIIKAGKFSTYNDNSATATQKAEKDWNEVVDYLNNKIIKKED